MEGVPPKILGRATLNAKSICPFVVFLQWRETGANRGVCARTVTRLLVLFTRYNYTKNVGKNLDAGSGITSIWMTWNSVFGVTRFPYQSLTHFSYRSLGVFHKDPLLFLLYVSDLPNTSSFLAFHLFADHTNLYFSSKNLSHLEANLNYELKTVAEWMKCNRLAISKTNYFFSFQ